MKVPVEDTLHVLLFCVILKTHKKNISLLDVFDTHQT